MTVQELIEFLEQCDPTAAVILSSDPEGNSYSPMGDHAEGYFDTKDSVYYSEDEFDGEVDEDDDYLDKDSKKPHGIPCITFWPSY